MAAIGMPARFGAADTGLGLVIFGLVLLAAMRARIVQAVLNQKFGSVVKSKGAYAWRQFRPPDAPSASPAIADKAEEKQRCRKRARGLGREGGRTGDGLVRTRGHAGCNTGAVRRTQVGANASLEGRVPSEARREGFWLAVHHSF